MSIVGLAEKVHSLTANFHWILCYIWHGMLVVLNIYKSLSIMCSADDEVIVHVLAFDMIHWSLQLSRCVSVGYVITFNLRLLFINFNILGKLERLKWSWSTKSVWQNLIRNYWEKLKRHRAMAVIELALKSSKKNPFLQVIRHTIILRQINDVFEISKPLHMS